MTHRMPVAMIPARLRTGWTVVGLIAVVVLAVWLPDLDLPLGDSDDGRILARFGLQARNFWEIGPAASGYGSSMAPYGSAVNYAHHPPLQNFIEITSVGIFGQGLVGIRILGFAIGTATVGFMAALLRGRGLAWGPTLLAVAAMSVTGFFFVYGRLGGGFSLIVASTAMVGYLRDRDEERTWVLAAGATLAAFTAMQSWIAMAAMGLLVLWLFAGRRFSVVTWWVAIGALIGVVLTAAWILNATDIGELSNQVGTRTDTAQFTMGEFLSRQWRFAGQLTPGWFRVLAFPALAAGLADRRTRAATGITLGVAAAWTFGLREGAWVHVLWNLPWVAPITIGMAALFDWVGRRLTARAAVVAGAVVTVVLVGTFSGVVTGPIHDRFLTIPADAGSIFEAVSPEPTTETVWIAPGISTARWISYYWDLPVRTFQERNLSDLGEADFVLVNTERIPDYLPAAAVEAAVEVEGRYVLIPAAAFTP